MEKKWKWLRRRRRDNGIWKEEGKIIERNEKVGEEQRDVEKSNDGAPDTLK